MAHTQETKDKIRKAKLGQKHTEEVKQSISNSLKGKILTDEHKQNQSKAHMGHLVSIETREKLSSINSERHKLIDCSGSTVEIENLKSYCKDHGISEANLINFGKTKGYQLLETTKKHKTFFIENIKTKEVHTTNNLSEFCQSKGFQSSSLSTQYKKGKPYKDYQILKIDVEYKTKKYEGK